MNAASKPLFTRPTEAGIGDSKGSTATRRLALGLVLFLWWSSSSAFAWNYLTPLTNLVVCPGDNATFSTVASGPTPYVFQWWKNGVVIPGKTNSSLTLLHVTASDTATYSVKLTGGYDSVTNSATLTVRTTVSATPLTNLVRFVGANAVFSTVASGTGPFTYAWRKNGGAITGATRSSLTLTNLAASDSATYSVVVSDPCSQATNSATLMVDTCFPALDVMLVIDRSGSMSGTPYNNARLACSNFVNNLHFTTNGDRAGLASYNSSATLDRQLTNSLGAFDLAVAGLPAASGNTSISLGLQTGQTELLSARHNPLALPVLVLLSDGQPTGSDTPSNALYQATLSKNAGTVIFTVGLGTNVDGNLLAGIASSPADYYFTTNSSQLTALFNAVSSIICRPPTNIVVLGPSNVNVCAGALVNFTVSASGCDSFHYQWDKNGSRIAGQTGTSLVISNAAVSDAGTYSVEVTSACRSVTNSATLAVSAPPTILCATNKAVQLGTAWSFDPPTGNYAVTVLSTVTNTAGHCGNTFDATRTWVVLDACGNTSSPCSQMVTVIDTTAPILNCTASTNKTVQMGQPWSFDLPTATDNGGTNITIAVVGTVTNTTGHCGSTFDATRTWVAQDACGNTSSPCSQTVTVIDTTAPILNCTASTNKTVQMGQPWSFDPPTATDNSGTNITIAVVGTVTNTTGHCGNTFDATRTWMARDECGNTSSPCSQTVTVIDTTAPILNCTASTNKTVQMGQPWSFDLPTATDNGGTNITIAVVSTVTNTTGHCGNTFDATRTWMARDECGNTSSPCSQTVTVIDTTAPILNCTASTNKTVQMGQPWSFDLPTATDNSGTNITIAVVSTVTNTTGHCGNTFDATRTWVARDACENTSSPCSQTVTVIDTTAPILNCSASTNKTVQIGQPWSFDLPTATDNGGTNITIAVVGTVTNTTGHCGSTFDATRTWVARDECGNTSSPCSQTVTVIDTVAPVLDCSASTNKTVQMGQPWSFDLPTATDNSGTNITIAVVGTVTNTTGHCGNTFDAARTWVARDECGNTSSPCSQTVTVIDTTAPILNCSASTNKTVHEMGQPWSFDLPTATDNGGTNITITVVGTVTNTTGHCGNTFDATRTWVARDECGNTSSPCSQTVTVIDTVAPVLNCTASTNKTVQMGQPWSFDLPTATDNGGTNITIAVVSTVTNTTGHCGNTFDATRTWMARDECGNTSSPCSQTVTVIDTTAPILNCTASTNKTVQMGQPWSFDLPTATDNSGTNITIAVVSTVTNTTGHCGNTFDATRTWVARDACENTSSPCSQTVTVIDTTAPILNCSASTNKTVQIGQPWSFDLPTATDNGGTNITIAVVGTVTNTTGHCGSTFDATRTWVARDECGNTSSPCSQTVTVIDTVAPVLDCSASTNKTVQMGQPWSFDLPTATDNSGTNITIAVVGTVTNTTGHCGNTFDAARTWVARDECGNTSSPCSQTVTVIDTTAPILNCSASTNKTVQMGQPWSFDPPTATDNSGTNITIAVVGTVTNTTGHCGNTFDATRTWVAQDECGNTSSPCSQTVTVIDTVAPVLDCTASTNKTVQMGQSWSFDLPTATDNSGTNITIAVVSTVTNTTGHCGNTFDATRTWVARDECGNTSSPCSQTVTVIDTTAPILNCTASTNKTVQMGQPWSFDLPTATDNGGTNITIAVVSTVTNTTGHCGNTFDATRTWVAQDACGNTSGPCSQTVTVVDTTAPILNCTASTNKTVQMGQPWSFDLPTATDNGGTNITIAVVGTVTNTTGHCGNTFDATRTWMARDECGNTSSPCSQTVTVIDTVAPVLDCSASTNKTVQMGQPWGFDPPTATDNSGTNITIAVVGTVTNTTGHCGNTFDATRTWVAQDECGNTSSPCSQTVTVIDTVAPVLDCSASTNKTVQMGQPWSFDPPTATDNSGTNITIAVVGTVTNTTGHCGNTFDATRTWVARDECGNTSSPCSQTVTVLDRTPILIPGPLSDQTVCAGTTVFLSLTATGTGLTYSWWLNGVVVGTNSTALLQGLPASTNTIQVVIRDACGAAVTNTATLLVKPGTTASALASVTRNLGDSVTFATVASGTGPFSYVWKKNGIVLSGRSGSSLTLTNLGYADGAVYRVEVTGGCNTAVQAATLTINNPPVANIVSPTNGAVFIAPANFKVLADAYDLDGSVTNVEFFQGGTTKLGQTNVAPYFIILTNVPAGTCSFTARATDNLGARGSSAPVSITVLPSPPLTIITALHFNPQTGLFEQTVRVTNPTGSTYNAVRVYVYNLTASMSLFNASGSTNGVPYVESHVAITPGSYVDFVIEYHVTTSDTPNPTLVAALVEPAAGGGVTVVGTAQHIDRAVMLSNKTLLLEFGSISNRLYYVQYSADLRTWQTVEPAITGTGARIQWVDNGEPQTPTPPAATPFRFYRVVWLP